MQVGIQFFPDIGPDVRSAREYWQQALSLVGLCDRYGYSHVRTVEHYFHPYGGYSPNPVVFLAQGNRTWNLLDMRIGACPIRGR
jgi:alkanesulfonate monooxygenase SsuD/methylene tetrahydromethanopterin reductase-like flavin-dependent oxidoreductase (luciferase family)